VRRMARKITVSFRVDQGLWENFKIITRKQKLNHSALIRRWILIYVNKNLDLLKTEKEVAAGWRIVRCIHCGASYSAKLERCPGCGLETEHNLVDQEKKKKEFKLPSDWGVF